MGLEKSNVTYFNSVSDIKRTVESTLKTRRSNFVSPRKLMYF